MSIEEMIPLALKKANTVDEISFSTRSGVGHAGYYAHFPDGGAITVSASQVTVVSGSSYNLDRTGDEWSLKTFLTSSKTKDVCVASLRFPGDRRDTYNPTHDEVAEFLQNYL